MNESVSTLIEATDDSLRWAKSERQALQKMDVVPLFSRPSCSHGDYLINYATCLLNRQIDIFDDSILLIENGSLASACAVSRGMIETYAVGNTLGNKLTKILGEISGLDSADKCLDVILKFTNSSRFKVEEQKRLHKGVFKVEDFALTNQAVARMEALAATSEHVLNSLRELYGEELQQSGQKESQFELTYEILSEWVHPSQTSLFHNYTPEVQHVPTSIGVTSIVDVARVNCVRALLFIVEARKQQSWLRDIADEITNRSERQKRTKGDGGS